MEGPQWTTGSIGRRCKPGNGLSRPVLIGRHEPHAPTHTHTRPRASAGAGGEPKPRVHYAAQNQPTPPPKGGRPPGAAHHNPTTVPAATAGGETPGPIPNPEAKPPSANGTAPTRERKSRTPPEHTPPARAGPAPQPGAHPHAGRPTPNTAASHRRTGEETRRRRRRAKRRSGANPASGHRRVPSAP